MDPLTATSAVAIVDDGIVTVMTTLGGGLPTIFAAFAVLVGLGLLIAYFKGWIGRKKK